MARRAEVQDQMQCVGLAPLLAVAVLGLMGCAGGPDPLAPPPVPSSGDDIPE